MKAIFVLTLAVLAGLAVACGDDDDDGNGGGGGGSVDVALAEWSVTPSQATAPAGDVTFTVTNDGTEPHEFLVIRSDLAPDALPVDDEGRVPEDEVDIIDEIEPFAADSTEEITLDLEAGSYVLICNIVELPPGEEPESHYENGMFTAFTVE
jgi:uncharacterized cupredoxin-like copper-binding protein